MDTMWNPKTSTPRVNTNNGTDRAALTWKRRFMSISSGFGQSSRLGSSGSDAMPQIGHEPEPSQRIFGCIGQVEMVSRAASGNAPLVGSATAGSCSSGFQILVRIGIKLMEAAGAAGRLSGATKLIAVWARRRIDLHSADRVDDRPMLRRSLIVRLRLVLTQVKFLGSCGSLKWLSAA